MDLSMINLAHTNNFKNTLKDEGKGFLRYSFEPPCIHMGLPKRNSSVLEVGCQTKNSPVETREVHRHFLLSQKALEQQASVLFLEQSRDFKNIVQPSWEYPSGYLLSQISILSRNRKLSTITLPSSPSPRSYTASRSPIADTRSHSAQACALS